MVSHYYGFIRKFFQVPKSIINLILAATNADTKWHCQNSDNHNKTILFIHF